MLSLYKYNSARVAAPLLKVAFSSPPFEYLLDQFPMRSVEVFTFIRLFDLSLPFGSSTTLSRFLFPGLGRIRSLRDSYAELEAFVIAAKAWLNVFGIPSTISCHPIQANPQRGEREIERSRRSYFLRQVSRIWQAHFLCKEQIIFWAKLLKF